MPEKSAEALPVFGRAPAENPQLVVVVVTPAPMALAMTPAPVSVIPTMTGAVVAGHGFALGVDPIHAGVPLGTCLEG